MSGALTRWYHHTLGQSGRLARKHTSPPSSPSAVASYSLGQLGWRRFYPGTSTAAQTPPSAPATFSGEGWHLPDYGGNEGWQFTSSTWSAEVALTLATAVSVEFFIDVTGIVFIDGQEVSRVTDTRLIEIGLLQAAFNLPVTVPTVLRDGPVDLQFELYMNLQLALGNASFSLATNSWREVPAWRQVLDRTGTDGVPTLSDAARRVHDAVRVPQEQPETAGTATRVVSYGRNPAEDAPVTPLPIRSATFRPVAFDAVPTPQDTAARQVAFARAPVHSLVVPTAVASRTVDVSRNAHDVVAVDDSAQRLVTYGRRVRWQEGCGDVPLDDPTKAIGGVVRTCTGEPYLDGAVVVLVRASDNKGVAVADSSTVDGSYSFPRNSYDTASYYVVAFAAEGTGEPLQAITERDLVPT